MTKTELHEGRKYLAHHSSGNIVVTLLHIVKTEGIKTNIYWGRKGTTRYVCKNEKTGREVIFKSSVKFIREEVT